jgi:hypothetical protein
MQVQARVRKGYSYFHNSRLMTEESVPFMVDTDSEEYKSQEWKVELDSPSPKKEEKETTTNKEEDIDDDGAKGKAVTEANNRAISRARRHKSE